MHNINKFFTPLVPGLGKPITSFSLPEMGVGGVGEGELNRRIRRVGACNGGATATAAAAAPTAAQHHV